MCLLKTSFVKTCRLIPISLSGAYHCFVEFSTDVSMSRQSVYLREKRVLLIISSFRTAIPSVCQTGYSLRFRQRDGSTSARRGQSITVA